MASPTLIYCASGNRALAQIAIDAGFEYGAQLPDTIYFPPYFADQDWKNPNRAAYMKALEKYRPPMATVLDWERPEQLPEVLEWAEDAAAFVEVVLIVPKVFGGIAELPRQIGGRAVHLAYSVPTKFSGTQVPVWEFSKWPVHLLGGSPQKQMEIALYLDVKSTDGNYVQKLANKNCQFWLPGTARYANNRWWPTLKEANGGIEWAGENAHHEAFRRSCQNIMKAWKTL
jgi:hypothetical protein